MSNVYTVALGWTAAVLVGSVTNPANLPIAIVCGAVSAVLPTVAHIATRSNLQECVELGLALRGEELVLPHEQERIAGLRARIAAAQTLLVVWALARSVTACIAAAVPLLVLWRLGGVA